MESSALLKKIASSKEFVISNIICDLGALFKDIKVIGKLGATDTVQVMAFSKNEQLGKLLPQLKNKKVFIKISFGCHHNGTEFETRMYRYLSTLIDHRTPNLIRPIVSFRCNKFSKSHNKPYMKKIWNRATKLKKDVKCDYGQELDIDNALFNVIEYQEGMTLDKLFINNDIDEDDLFSILFQIFYTLRELSLAGVRHNDIHFGNVYINILDKKKRLIYFYDQDKYSVIETKYIVKIYDFDNSSFTITGAPRNTYIENSQCPDYGMCSNKDDRYDLFIIIKRLSWLNYINMKSNKLLPVIENFIKLAVPDSSFMKSSCCEFPDRRCVKIPGPTKKSNEICSPNAVIPSDKVLDLRQLCDKGAFPNLYNLRDGYDWGFDNLYISQICGDDVKFVGCLKKLYKY